MLSLRTCAILAVAAGCSLSSTFAEDNWAKTVKFPASEKPVELFAGEKFEGGEGHVGKWFTRKGDVIIAKNTKEDAPKTSTYLLTKKNYKNFRLVFEGKLVESGMHSGISMWGKKERRGEEDFTYQGHLVMFPTGWGFWDLYRRNGIYQDDGRAKKADNKGWNKMEILAQAPRIRLAVNGQLVADWKDPMPELCVEGPIGLQLHSNPNVAQEVQFRGLILSENPEDKMITVEEAK